MPTPASVELSCGEFEICWDYLRLGELPQVLDLPSPGVDWEERRRLVTGALQSLRGKGVANQDGPLPELVDMLTGLARFGWAVDAWMDLERPVRARGAVSGETGILAVIEGDTIRLDVVANHEVLPALVGLAGDPPGSPTRRTASVSVRTDALDAALAQAGNDPQALVAALVSHGERPDDARALANLVEHVGWRGQYAGTTADQRGTQHREPRVIGFHDTPTARILHLRRDDWTTLTPATTGHLTRAITELVGGVG